MNKPDYPIDEARLTAFALGELSPDEHAEIERAITGNPAAQAAVKRIRDLSVQLKGALLNEQLPAVRPLDFRAMHHAKPGMAQAPGKVLRFPYYWVGGLAAACVAAMFVLHQRELSLDEPIESGHVIVAAKTPPAPVALEAVVREDVPEPYSNSTESKFLPTLQNPLSTFSADVSTASYENVRRFLESGQRPPQDAVKIEELVNYFNYRYSPPMPTDVPFSTAMEVASAPWNPAHRLVRIGIKGREIADENRPPANLVFLVDVSGSMSAQDKLPLAKQAMRVLAEKLRPGDRIAIVTSAGATGLALPSTPIALKNEVLSAIETLQPSDTVASTYGARGLQLAYDIAKANFVSDGVNRVILCVDHDFDLGRSNEAALNALIESRAESGLYLTTLAFGAGRSANNSLALLAALGQGNYGRVDTLPEAKRLLLAQATSALNTIAKDVTLQVEFNPAQVAAYRLIGYENRKLANAELGNDSTDAGEIGSGHTVTALYEVIPVGQHVPTEALANGADPLKYQVPAKDAAMLAEAGSKQPIDFEMLTLKIRYKPPQVEISRKVEIPVIDQGKLFADASLDFQFAASVAGFGMILRQSPHKGDADFDAVIKWAGKAAEESADPKRKEFIEVVKKAKTLQAE